MNENDVGQPQEVAVRRIGKEGEELAIFEFQGNLRELIISSLQESFLTTGNYSPNAKAISSQGAMSLALAGTAMGATALAASFSPTLFMATANPATLMSLGGGVGSAVMGSSGIVAQAAFIPVASSIPVVAPILAVQALNTAVLMHQFKQVDSKLDTIKNALDKAIARSEATHAGELLTASRIVDDVYLQYSEEGAFSQDMLMRLALAERDVKTLASRFLQLVEARSSLSMQDLSEIDQMNYDAHSAMLSSFVELRVAYLRICVDMQENPKSVANSVENLKALIDNGTDFWQRLHNRSRVLKAKIDELEANMRDANWVERNLPGRKIGQELAQYRHAYTSTMESEREIMEDFLSFIKSAQATRKALDTPASTDQAQTPTLVAWTDERGEHSFVTDQDLLTLKPR